MTAAAEVSPVLEERPQLSSSDATRPTPMKPVPSSSSSSSSKGGKTETCSSASRGRLREPLQVRTSSMGSSTGPLDRVAEDDEEGDRVAVTHKTTIVVDDERLSPRVGILRTPSASLEGEAWAAEGGHHHHHHQPPRSPRGRGLSFDKIERGERFSLWHFLAFEAFGERHSTGLDDSVPRAIDNFLAVPARFERFVALGLLVSLDTFLDAVTFLPLRATVAVVAVVLRAARRLSAHWLDVRNRGQQQPRRSRGKKPSTSGGVLLERALTLLAATGGTGPVFNRARAYDLMRFATVLVGKAALTLVPMSRAYHWIRGQNTIKLYVIVGIMEVLDRLACAFGQDALDSFYLTTRRYETARDGRRVLVFLLVVNGVVLLHAGLLYVHITTLNVVVNASEDSAIVALLISNNFSEIKAFVFKKYNARNLFDVACSDVCERFKLCLFLGLLTLLAWSQAIGSADLERRREGVATVLQQASVIMLFELIADWVKHAFMAKFNKLDAAVYDDFADRLARDVVTGRGGRMALDHTHVVTRRLGLAVLPLACVAARYLSIAAGWLRLSLQLSAASHSLVVAAFALCVFQLKILTSICVAGVSVGLHAAYLRAKAEHEAAHGGDVLLPGGGGADSAAAAGSDDSFNKGLTRRYRRMSSGHSRGVVVNGRLVGISADDQSVPDLPPAASGSGNSHSPDSPRRRHRYRTLTTILAGGDDLPPASPRPRAATHDAVHRSWSSPSVDFQQQPDSHSPRGSAPAQHHQDPDGEEDDDDDDIRPESRTPTSHKRD